jgi:hypothetical protein
LPNNFFYRSVLITIEQCYIKQREKEGESNWRLKYHKQRCVHFTWIDIDIPFKQ